MQTVVSEGTGVGGAVDGYDVAGKTGTAERADENGGYLKENYMSSFMGFAPAQSPKVLCYITLDERRAAQMPLRCRSSPLWPTRSTCWVSRTRSRGLQSLGRGLLSHMRGVHMPCTTHARRWDTIRR